MLGRIDQGERHRQCVDNQHETPGWSNTAPEEYHDQRRQSGVQRRDGRHQVHTGLSGVHQCPRGLQVQRAPAARGDALHEGVRPRLVGMHGAQQAAVGYADGAAVHASRVRRSTRDVLGRAARGGPRRRRGHHDVDDQGGKRQRDEASNKCSPIGPVAQPQHAGDHIGQQEKRHVDGADNDFPPRRVCHLEVPLQPHRRDRPEKHPPVRLWLQLPQTRRAEQRRRSAAEVVQQQHHSERQPVAYDCEHLVTAADAGGHQPGRDVEQQQFAVEGQPRRHGSIEHHQQPHRHRDSTQQGQPAVMRLFGGC